MFKRKPKGQTTVEYTEALKEFNELDEQLNMEYIAKVQDDIIKNPAEFWSFAKSKKKTTKFPLEMHYDQRISDQPQDVVEMFADYFESLYVKNDPVNFNEVYGKEPEAAWEVNLHMVDIEKAILSLKMDAGAGPDSLSPIVVRKCADSLVWPIWILHQKAMEMGRISSMLKSSRVVPVFKKKGKKTDVRNYRITAISSVLMRIYESAIQTKLVEHIDHQLSNAQHGFRPKRSISTNLMNLSIAAHDAFARRQQLDVFYGDFENAFDKIWHLKLVEKIKAFGIGKKTAKWLFEFVDGRQFYVKIGNLESRRYEASSGVPAGSILGPSLFLIGINDIVDCVEYSLVLLFADDIKLATLIDSASDIRFLQIDIDNVLRWSEENRLPFNCRKCEILTISRRAQPHYGTYYMEDQEVGRRFEIRDLGILINQHFSFGAHIERITARARQAMGFIKSISKGQFNTRALVVLYSAYVRSKLEFGSVIWDPYQKCYIEDLESVQRQFVLYALGDVNRVPPYRLRPYADRCEELGLASLSNRREEANVMMAYDLYNNRIRDSNIESRFIRRTCHYSLINCKVLTEERYETDYGFNQPLAKKVRLINEHKDLVMLNRSEFNAEIKSKLSDEKTAKKL